MAQGEGDYREDSDWDILTVTVERLDKYEKIKFVSEIMDRLLELGIDSEIIVVSSEYYRKYRDVYGGLAGIATLEGVAI